MKITSTVVDRKKRRAMGRWRSRHARTRWTMKGGEKICLRDMGDGHLTNSIKLLIRRAAFKYAIDVLEFLLLALRHDDAPDFDRNIDYHYPEMLKQMIEEYTFRGLDDLKPYADHCQANGDLYALKLYGRRNEV